MTYSCLYAMGDFVKKYLDVNQGLKILEVGSLDVHNPRKDLVFRRYFRDNPKWEFVGLDIEAGENVDVVSEKPYDYPFPDNHFDVVISGNTLEHVEDLHKIIKEIARIAKDLIYITVPNAHPHHMYPIDCWRIFPDGMRFLLEDIAGLEIVECKKDKKRDEKNTIGIARKKHG